MSVSTVDLMDSPAQIACMATPIFSDCDITCRCSAEVVALKGPVSISGYTRLLHVVQTVQVWNDDHGREKTIKALNESLTKQVTAVSCDVIPLCGWGVQVRCGVCGSLPHSISDGRGSGGNLGHIGGTAETGAGQVREGGREGIMGLCTKSFCLRCVQVDRCSKLQCRAFGGAEETLPRLHSSRYVLWLLSPPLLPLPPTLPPPPSPSPPSPLLPTPPLPLPPHLPLSSFCF